MQFLRKFFFYIFAAVYIIFCPLILLYAFGYIYKPGAEESLVKTGVIYLSTAPGSATVYLKDAQCQEETPTVIRELLPGSYSVKLVLDGYKAWTRTVPVEAEKATVLDKILLLPLQWKAESLLPEKLQDILPVPKSGFFLVAGGDTTGDIFVYNYKEEKSYELFDKDSPFKDLRLVSYFTAEGSSAVLLRADSRKGEKFLWVTLGGDKSTVEDITDLFPVKPDTVKWLPQQEESLFAFQEGYLNMVDVDSGAVYPDYVRDVRGYGLCDGEIYVLRNDNVFLKMDYDAKSEKALMDDPALGASIFGQEGFFQIEIPSEDFIIFLGSDGQLLTNRLPYRFIEKGARGIEFYPKLKRALIWEKDRIGVLDFTTEETQDVQFEKPPSLLWVYSGGKDIEQCFWVYEGSHILFRDGSDVFLVEIEEYGEVTLNHVFRVEDKSAIYYSEQTGKMYFVDPATNGLFSVEIVPAKGVMPAPFPEIKEEEEKKEDVDEI